METRVQFICVFDCERRRIFETSALVSYRKWWPRDLQHITLPMAEDAIWPVYSPWRIPKKARTCCWRTVWYSLCCRRIFFLVYGKSDTEEEAIVDHDRKLQALMDRCRERGLVQNKDKLPFRQKEMRFIDHLYQFRRS